MGSSAQNSSGVHWCRRRVRFNGRFGEALVQSQARFNRVPEKVPEKSGRVWCRAASSSTRFRRRFWRRFRRKFRRRSWEARSGSTAFRRRFWRRFRRRSGRLWCRAASGSTGFQRRFRRRGSLWCRSRSRPRGIALVQSRARFSEVPEKVPEGFGWVGPGSTRFQRRFRRALVQSWPIGGGLRWRAGPGSARFRRRFWKRFRKVLLRPGSTRLQVGSGAIPGLRRRSFSVKFQQISDEKNYEKKLLLLLLGIPPKLIFIDKSLIDGQFSSIFH